jgi:undecaprenyl diphosphate synthase
MVAIEPMDNALPSHVAIIMDGNGRWAKARGLPRTAGHRKGADAVRRAVEAAGELGIPYLTLFSFSCENWKRPAAEIHDLMGLLRRYIRSEIAELHEKGVRLRVIGERHRLAPDIIRMIEDAEARTRDNTSLTLVIAISYGGRQEIVNAARRLASAAAKGELDPAAIDEDIFASALETQGIPDPDLLIRTSGEKRISNFLLWQLAYGEMVFTDRLWPDFSKEDFTAAIAEYMQRERRYGAAISSG